MIEGFKIITVTHHQASLQDIQKVILHPDGIGDRLSQLKSQIGIPEILYLATCNRVCYFLYDEKEFGEDRLQSFFQFVNPALSSDNWTTTRSQINFFQGKQAMQHLFELAASINSMVIGEREIFRQLREAYDFAKEQNLTGDNIRLAMRFTIEAAKCVYANTAIGEKALSVVALAFQQMMMKSQNREARVLMVGSGQTNTLFGKFLQKHQFTNITIFNRSIGGAQILANQLGGKAYSLNDLKNYKGGFDIMVVCTGSVECVITPDLYEQLIGTDGSSKILIDLSVPNNVDRKVIQNYNVHYIEVEALKEKAKENLEHRLNAIEAVKTILADFMNQFITAFKQRLIERALHKVPEEIKSVKDRAINQVFAKEFETLDESSKDLLLRMMTYMEKGCINIPMKAAREAVV
jgi:glutamyl-tRNA reductase